MIPFDPIRRTAVLRAFGGLTPASRNSLWLYIATPDMVSLRCECKSSKPELDQPLKDRSVTCNCPATSVGTRSRSTEQTREVKMAQLYADQAQKIDIRSLMAKVLKAGRTDQYWSPAI